MHGTCLYNADLSPCSILFSHCHWKSQLRAWQDGLVGRRAHHQTWWWKCNLQDSTVEGEDWLSDLHACKLARVPPNTHTHTIHIFKIRSIHGGRPCQTTLGKRSVSDLSLWAAWVTVHLGPGYRDVSQHLTIVSCSSQLPSTFSQSPGHGPAFLQPVQGFLTVSRQKAVAVILCPPFHLPSDKLLSCFCRFHSVFHFLGEALKYVAGSGCYKHLPNSALYMIIF